MEKKSLGKILNFLISLNLNSYKNIMFSNFFFFYYIRDPMGSDNLVKKQIGGDFNTSTITQVALGAVDGGDNTVVNAVTINYETKTTVDASFTGDDTFQIIVKSGNSNSELSGSNGLGYENTSDAVQIDEISYAMPVGAATLTIGESMDISKVYSQACSYSGLTERMSNCGAANSAYVGGSGVTVAASFNGDNGLNVSGGLSFDEAGILTKESTDRFGLEVDYFGDSFAVSGSFAHVDADGEYIGVLGYYTFDMATVSAGFECHNPDTGEDKNGFFLGVSAEAGPGTVEAAYGTLTNYGKSETELYGYELSYSLPVNDSMTILGGIYCSEESGSTTDKTGVLVEATLSF